MSDERGLTIVDSWLPFPDSEENQKTSSKPIAILFYNPTMVSAFAEGYYHTGILRIPWSDILDVFDGIYLSWDPQRWTKVLVFHGYVSSLAGIYCVGFKCIASFRMWNRNGEDENCVSTFRIVL